MTLTNSLGNATMQYSRVMLLGAAALALAALVSPTQAEVPSETARQIKIGKAVAPVPLNTAGRDRNSVFLGSYLVNVTSGCNDCHSNKQYTDAGNPFLGQPKEINVACYLNGGQAFGPFVSRNLTPDASGKPAGDSFATFVKAMRTGEDPKDPGTLLQVMPWPAFQKMSDTDLRAIYDYLSAVPSLPDGGASPC